MPGLRSFNTVRARSYIFRLPLFTRAIIAAIVLLWLLGAPGVFNVQQWGSLIPDQMSFATGMRICVPSLTITAMDKY